jgi:hypothetical protein
MTIGGWPDLRGWATMTAMFILYAVLAGFVLGLLTGGSPGRLGRLSFRWGWLIALGMILQLSLFSTPIGQVLSEDAAKVAYIVSNVMVLVAVAANLAIRGLILVFLGGLSNLIAIVANGGSMPVSPDALQALSRLPESGYSNSVLVADPRLVPLTDIFAMPSWVPAANVFSVGDVLIGVGAAIVIIAAMHGRGLPPVTPAEPVATVPEAGAPEPSIDAGARAH